MTPHQMMRLARMLCRGHYSLSDAIDAIEEAATHIKNLTFEKKQLKAKLKETKAALTKLADRVDSEVAYGDTWTEYEKAMEIVEGK